MQIDSGAVDTVGPKEIGQAFEIRETKAAKSGRNYVAANGTKINNYGEILIKGLIYLLIIVNKLKIH